MKITKLEINHLLTKTYTIEMDDPTGSYECQCNLVQAMTNRLPSDVQDYFNNVEVDSGSHISKAYEIVNTYLDENNINIHELELQMGHN